MVCRRFRNHRDDERDDELGELRGFAKPRNGSTLQARQSGNLPFNFGGMIKKLRRFTKRRNGSTLRAAQGDNLSFKRQGMTRRSMPCLFHANLFALDVAR